MKIIIDGTNLAALVCSHQLLLAGHEVTMEIPTGAKLGGYFAGIKIENQIIDLGMVLLEPRFTVEPKPIESYNYESGQAGNAYNNAVFSWLDSLDVALEEVPVFSQYNGEIFVDFLIADSLEILSKLDAKKRDEFSQVLEQIEERPEMSPRNKTDSSFFELPISKVFPALYGQLLSKFLLDVGEKVAGPYSERLTAKYHRMLWLPLYYPETLADQFREQCSALEELKFYSPSQGGVSGLCHQLLERLEATARFKVEEKDHDLNSGSQSPLFDPSPRLSFIDESELSDVDSQTLTSAIGFAVFKETSAYEKRVVHNLTKSDKWFRLSQSLSHEGVVVVEVGYIDEEICDSEIAEWAMKALIENGVTSYSEPLIFRSRVFFPTELKRRTQKRVYAVNTYATFLDTRSFNNQVALGLKAAMDFANTEENYVREI